MYNRLMSAGRAGKVPPKTDKSKKASRIRT